MKTNVNHKFARSVIERITEDLVESDDQTSVTLTKFRFDEVRDASGEYRGKGEAFINVTGNGESRQYGDIEFYTSMQRNAGCGSLTFGRIDFAFHKNCFDHD